MSHITPSETEPPNNDEPVRRRWSKSRVLVWGVGIVVIGGMLIAILLPSLCRTGGTANRIKCAMNLRQIGQAINLYAQDNSGQFPPSLAVLLAHEDISSAVMVCPSSNDVPASATDAAQVIAELSAAETNAPGHKSCLSYVYVGRGMNTKTVSDKTVVAYEPLDNHVGTGGHVLFGDWHVDWIDKQSWPKIVTVGVAILPSPTTRP